MALGCCGSDASLFIGIFAMSGVVADFPLFLAVFPDEVDYAADPVGAMVVVSYWLIIIAEVLILQLGPFL